MRAEKDSSLENPPLLKQAEGRTGSADGLALFGSQIRKLKSVAVACTIAHHPAHLNWCGCNRDGELQVDRSTDIPSCDKYSRDSPLVNVQRASANFAALHPDYRRSQFGFEFIPLMTSGPGAAFGLLVLIHDRRR